MKNFLIIIILILLLFPSFNQAQNLLWTKDMGDPMSVFSFLAAQDNSFFISLQHQRRISPTDFLEWGSVINFDEQGNKIWQLPFTTRMYKYGNEIMINDSSWTSLIFLDYSGNIVNTKSLPEVVSAGLRIDFISQNTYDENYYILCSDSTQTQMWIYAYAENFNFIRSFQIFDGQMSWVYNCFVLNGYLYTSRNRYGQGDFTNMVSDIYKYDLYGNLIWTKELLDRLDPHLVKCDDGVYFGATKFYQVNDSTSFEGWEISKIDTSNGNPIWTKMWKGTSNFFTLQVVWGVLNLPNGGCLIYGATDKPGQVREGYYDPFAIAYSDNGDSLFAIRNTRSTSYGGVSSYFALAGWDNKNNLILAGNIDTAAVLFQSDEGARIWKYSIPGITAVKEQTNIIPTEFILQQNYPNPFNPTTTIKYSISERSFVSLKVYDILGNMVANLVNKEEAIGNYSIEFNASKLPSGVYFYRLQSGDISETKKLVLLK